MHADYQKARRHLSRRDKILKQLIASIGPCSLLPNPDGFHMLVRSIISQQISTKAARAIAGRLENTLGRRGVKPRAILELSEEQMRAAGLSASKVKSLRDLAEKVATRTVPLKTLGDLTDEEVIESLIPVRGIGRWTAEMYLIFSLGRMDVLPVDDLGLRSGIQKQYSLKEMPKKEVIVELAEPWRPYRSIATWYLWRSLGNVPGAK